MLSTRRIMKAWIYGVLALASAPAGATPVPAGPGGSGAVWGYHPRAGESAEYPDVCSLDAAHAEVPFTPAAGRSADCPTPPPPPSGVCPGTRELHEDLNSCQGERCCLPGSVGPGGVVDVVPYLTRPAAWPFSADTSVDHSTDVDDSPGIAQAIECAMSQSTTRHTVAFPAGRYVLRTPLRPEHDDLTLEGPELFPDAVPGDPGTATLVALPCNPEQFPGVIQVNKTDTVSRVGIRNFQIALTDGPRVRANSGIRINNCSECAVENVIMRYEPLSPQPPECKPEHLDGITFSLGSGGVIRNVIVDGVPKGGIYLSSITGYHATPPILVENCEIKNSDGPVGAGGIKIITSNVTVRNCESHHNRVSSPSRPGGYGLWIATQVPGIDNPSPVPSNVVVQDSYFHHNGNSGVTMASAVEDHRPMDIELVRVGSAYNGSYGVHIQAGTDLKLRDVSSWGNGYYGIYLTSRTTLAASSLRVGSVLLENPHVFDNALTATSALPGIMIEASNVTIHRGELARYGASGGNQTRSIQQRCWTSGPPGEQVLFHPENNVISGVRTRGTSAPEVLACTL
ncbi:hypothetical protein SOCE26_056650 [Sorangium cellulosum]|uniref:Rhamnogalacturonase A/B/Epimerase-like pectate lyase domain-containing protein n=1 Tax=Sorangium cellulosum TaxID=56 RepID=A0A2L0EY12_SORCE|nr:right-handed parallel beta-helix repeat-containing protein [Sorangium cellulosum]AUX44201.1 hypothetical protein SOCE26_056650 [Sorangium cellulosum]